MKILYIDDDALLRGMFSRVLQKSYEVSVASSGEEGLQKLAESPFDLVICDYNMPGLTGVDVWQRLDPHYKLRFLLFTGDYNVKSPSGFLLRKPVTAAEIVDYVRYVFSTFEESPSLLETCEI